MSKANVYQIFYSEQTKNELDSGFIPLDNTGQRPDWGEYWPIRSFLLGSEMNEDEFYGFLSPKFKLKTGLNSSQVIEFAASLDDSIDIVLFPPFFAMGAVYENVFVQGAIHHPGTWPLMVESAGVLTPGVNLETLVMDSTNTQYCNYFLAKPRFWRYWLEKTELLFQAAEKNDSSWGRALNKNVFYNNAYSWHAKVFIIERVVSLLLATESRWKSCTYNPALFPCEITNYAQELLTLDALKMALVKTGYQEYRTVFVALRDRLLRELN